MDEEIRKKIIVAEFEPGFINAYENEDRLYTILEYMDLMDYWISDFIVKELKGFLIKIFLASQARSITKF